MRSPTDFVRGVGQPVTMKSWLNGKGDQALHAGISGRFVERVPRFYGFDQERADALIDGEHSGYMNCPPSR